MTKFDTIKECLNESELLGFHNIKIGDALHYHLERLDYDCIKSKIQKIIYSLKNLLRILMAPFYLNYSVKSSGNDNTLFLYSNSYGARSDLFDNFKATANIVVNKIVIFPSKRFKISLDRIYQYSKLFSWYRILKKKREFDGFRIAILKDIFCLYLDYYECSLILSKRSEINYLVTFCDVQPLESIFTQEFRKNGRTTITLQHGVFCSTFNEWALTGFKSDYMFGYGQFTVDEAVKLGINPDRIYKAGSLSLINKTTIRPSMVIPKNMGVLLDGDDPYLPEYNEQMLKESFEFCRKNNLSLFIKFHPASDYNYYLNNNPYLYNVKTYHKDLNVVEFLQKVDFVIVRNTTCLIDALQYWKPSFILEDKTQPLKVYENVRICKIEKVDDLRNTIIDANLENILEIVDAERKYFCEDGDPSQRIKLKFNELGIY